MPMKLNVGLSKKLGLSDYGSIGASCHVELELEGSLLQSDLEAFHRHVRGAFVACRQAVQDELARHQDSAAVAPAAAPPEKTSTAATGSFDRRSARESNGSGSARGNGNGAPHASPKQMEYLQQLARQIRGLGVRRLDGLAQKMFGKPLAALTTLDASGLIDTLKSIKAGEIDLNAVLSGEPS